MKWFVKEGSIVREIWGKADTILFIFAGASAEFALNKSVDWLYFTGRLPADPLGRLFSTVGYARQIVFSEYDDAMRAIRQIAAIHQGVERSRNARIPDSAYRDVLFMLIDYSIRSFELLERELTLAEKEELFNVFYTVGEGMGVPGLPVNLHAWERMRAEHLQENLVKSHFTIDLYKQYRKHLGWYRYHLLRNVQMQLVPERVNALLGLGQGWLVDLLLPIYKFSRQLGVGTFLRNILLPENYKTQVIDLDMAVH
ncbi:oxygenase MpaB family protein [Dyadobacter sp. BHUBP1]|uniref:oxygenase MpaB family protein n=1 Tax=Dyadobacter sp. BHUBP1 TaxID=3424178 RepID=UPI003D337034